MTYRRITVRVSPDLHDRAARVAGERDESLNTLVVEAIEAFVGMRAAATDPWPLEALSALLAPAADASDITAEELQRHLRDVRRRIWSERYVAATRASRSEAV